MPKVFCRTSFNTNLAEWNDDAVPFSRGRSAQRKYPGRKDTLLRPAGGRAVGRVFFRQRPVEHLARRGVAGVSTAAGTDSGDIGPAAARRSMAGRVGKRGKPA